ncbi:hypothetical protein pEaSNUABM50_00054 [Erwinia phage pEa_SNUABM_50]|uniref:Uncharacterized protein n=4 Tax=Eneladusvirus BF TaxID=2560751 RepID=A0A7L8ZNC1_9CAUD|nr:hypothetical protein FDH34_gp056 [Serratia phage BF]QOI70994.1 hypothetical protein pEaSNUABM12_00056 [Erwinia phage pEa_SNUABM_12]QOI71539.1 hypothetical protein pEaSNUABM47_00055 [Erwinia phage pEa_SNUABM_47]QOI72078.1 hypothetical protein pEaSNUABM50_00054 [Erwinia phage pEa_SNUABM_50]QXO11203.1 hypothetical protein pEaSNUABM19_00057 [Erwinia phage pEa_SNUABM_19]QXO11751.1 hypothetical protein pEaSNUABM44_00055 [Erwinia phage pEa_SNUABM_44]QXO12302.1 hypothetical protein pEaSNUABM49_000
MKRKIKFKDGAPKYIWLGNRGFPNKHEVLTWHDESIIRVSDAPSYRGALERIYTFSKLTNNETETAKYEFALCHYLDDEDEDTFYLLLQPFSEWHKMIDMDNKDETT